jgi:type IV secretion system protein VirB9
MKLWLAMTCGLAMFAFAGVSHAENSDARLQLVPYLPGHPAVVRMVPGTGVLIMLAQGEHIQTIRLSDPSAYQVNVAAVGDSLLLRQTRPLQQAAMTIETDQRGYEFSLIASEDLNVPYLVHFSYSVPILNAVPSPSAPSAQAEALTGYKLRGTKALRPQSIVDDGERTFIQWAPNQPIPAVFAMDPLGHEAMVDGYMREGTFTIDRVHDKLVFRIDKAVMTASRQVKKRKRS